MSLSSAADIEKRFLSECENIRKYIAHINTMTVVDDYRVSKLKQALRGHKLPRLRGRDASRRGQPFSWDDAQSLLDRVHVIATAVRERINRHATAMKELFDASETVPEDAPNFEEWVGYFYENSPLFLSEDVENEIVRNVFGTYKESVAHLFFEEGDYPGVSVEPVRDISEEDDDNSPAAQQAKTLIRTAMRESRGLRHHEKVMALRSLLREFDDLEIAVKMLRPAAEINLLRQGYILLMTAFDAAIFDLCRAALKHRFFELIEHFGGKANVSLKWIAECGSSERFQGRVIENQLKNKYVKDVIADLRRANVDLLIGGNEDYQRLSEMIQRRNVHVHNRGIVDERYIESDDDGQPKYNIDNLTLGAYAEIDPTYWERANIICQHCVRNLAQWAGSAAPQQS